MILCIKKWKFANDKRLHLSPHTIETYRHRLKIKLDVSNSTELTRKAVKWLLERR
jgi:DNA-binding CsgD family transcriptional regulator